jgi:hypothetical protein
MRNHLVHGRACGATTWPTTCFRCRRRVFFFQCQHGSRVIFDEPLGPPWPHHDCDRLWAGSLRRTVDDAGRISVEVAERVTVERPSRRFSIEPTIVSEAQQRSPEGRDPIVRQEATRSASEDYVGILRERIVHVDPLQYYRLPSTAVARASLQRIGRQPVGRITVHVPSPFGNELESYSAFAPSGFLDEDDVRVGAVVAVRLEGVLVMIKGAAWFCSSLEVVS